MGKSSGYSYPVRILFGLMIAAVMIAALPSDAHALAQDVIRGDSFMVDMFAPANDTSLVPGGVMKFYMNTAASFGCSGVPTNPDTFTAVDIYVDKPATTILSFGAIIDTMQLILDANNNQRFDLGENTIIATTNSPFVDSGSAAQYRFSPIQRVLLSTYETYVVVIYTKNNLTLGDSQFFVRIPNRAATIVIDTSIALNVQRPLVGTIDFATYRFKVYNDSVSSIAHANYTTYVHVDSSLGYTPLNVFHGRLQGETRTVGGDSLSRVGVHLAGNAADSVTSVWGLFGQSNTRVDFTQITPYAWAASGCTTVSLLGSALDTFRVLATVSAPITQSTLSCTVPVDSIATKFRLSNLVATDSSGVIFFTKPRVALSDSNLPSLSVHPDTRVERDSVLAASGTINADSLLTPQLSYDTVARFAVSLAMGNGLALAHFDTVILTVNGTAFAPVAAAVGNTVPGDSVFVYQPNLTFGTNCTYQVYVRTNNFATRGETYAIRILVDSVATRHRDSGPSSVLVGSRTCTIVKYRVSISDSTIPSVATHPDTEVQRDSIMIAAGTINADTILNGRLSYDTVTRFAVSLQMGNALAVTHFDTVILNLNGTAFAPIAAAAASTRIGDSIFVYRPNLTFGTTCTYQIYVRTNNFATIADTFRAVILVDSIASEFRDSGPSVDVLGSRTCTIYKPRIALSDSVIPSVFTHPDTEVQRDSILVAVGTINADTLLSGQLSYDTVKRFAVSLRMGNALAVTHFDTVMLFLQHPQGDSQFAPIAAAARSLTFGDSVFVYIPNLTFATTCTYRVYVRTNNNATIGETFALHILVDSVASRYRDSGPSSVLVSSRTCTIAKPRVDVADSALSAIYIHPDTEVQNDSTLVAAGTIKSDTLLSGQLTYDTVRRFGVRLVMSAGFNATHIDTVMLFIQHPQGDSRFSPVAAATATPTLHDSTYIYLPNLTFGSNCTYAVYVRTNNWAPSGETFAVQILVDSIAAKYRDSGPSVNVAGSRTCTIAKYRVSATDSTMTSLFVHPDTELQNDSVLVAAGRINADTVLGGILVRDTLTRVGVRLVMSAGLNATHFDTVMLYIAQAAGGDSRFAPIAAATATPTLHDSTYIYRPNLGIGTYCTYQVYVRTNNWAPSGETFAVQILVDSIASRYRDSGPSVTVVGSRTCTLAKYRVSITDSTLLPISSHPDTQLQRDSIFIAAGRINADTVLGGVLNRDSIVRFGVRLVMSAGLNSTHFDTVMLYIAQPAGGDSRFAPIAAATATPTLHDSTYIYAPNLAISAYCTYQVYVRTNNWAPNGETFSVQILVDSVAARFRDSGPSTVVAGSRSCTIVKQDVILDSVNLGNVVFHPDSRVSGFRGVKVAAGQIRADSISGIVGDSVSRFGVSLILTGGVSSSFVESVAVEINGDTRTMTREGARDSWFIIFSKDISDTANYAVWVRVTDTVPNFATCSATIPVDSITTTYRNPGPKSIMTGSRITTFLKQDVILVMQTLANQTGHPDTRVSGRETIIVSSGVISADSTSGIVNDTLTRLGMRAALTGGITNADIDSFALVVNNNETFTATNVPAGTDSWLFTPNKLITDTASFRIYVTFRDSALPGATVRITIPTDSIVTTFRSSGPKSDTSSTGIATCSKPILGVNTHYLTTPGNDTINPIVAFGNKVLVCSGTYFVDSSLIIPSYDTIRQVVVFFGGSARDSVYNAQYSIGLTGSWLSLSKAGVDTWQITGLDSRVVTSDTWAVRINMADSTTIGTTLSASVMQFGETTQWSTPGPGSLRDSSGTFIISADAVQLGMWTLFDTYPAEFQQLAQNPIMVCSGQIFINIGPVIMPSYDTLTSFGVQFDTQNPEIASNDSIQAVSLYLWAVPGIRNFADTISLVVDSTASADSRLWRMPPGADTTIADSQPFQIFVRIKTDRNFHRGETLAVRIAKDSVNTTFTSGLAGDTHSSRIVYWRWPDTTFIVQTALVDTNVNPDTTSGQNPFLLYAGRIQGDTGSRRHPIPGSVGDSGQQYFPLAGDSLTYFGIQILSAVTGFNTSDSIETVIVYLGTDTGYDASSRNRPLILTRTASSPDGFGGNIWHWQAAADSTLLGGRNGESFAVYAQVITNVALGTNYRVQARQYWDSITTYFMAESRPAQLIVGTRRVTFTKTSLGIDTQTLGDTTLAPDRRQNDSIVLMDGILTATAAPADTITAMIFKLTTTGTIIGESVTLKIEFESGLFFHPATETTLNLYETTTIGAPKYRLAVSSAGFGVDTGQHFKVRAILTDSAAKYLGGSIRLTLESTTAQLSIGSPLNLYGGRLAKLNYVDTVSVTDSALVDTTVHPDSRARMNPFVAGVFRIQGQTSAFGVSDTIQQIGVVFTGTAGTSDSVLNAWINIDTGGLLLDSFALIKRGFGDFGVVLDSRIPYGTVMTCTIYARVNEAVANGSSLRAVIGYDSISTLLTNFKDTVTSANRLVTFDKPTFSIEMTALVDTIVAPFPQMVDSSQIMAGRFASTFATSDSLTTFGVRLALTGGLTGESITVIFRRDQGTVTPSFDTFLKLVTPLSSTPEFRLNDSVQLTIDTEQQFSIFVAVNDSPHFRFLGTIASCSIPTDSASASWSKLTTGNLTSGRRIAYAYTDTIAIADSSLVSITVHPDSDLGQNPFIAMIATFKGQTSELNVPDTFQRLGFVFTGTAKDSVVAAWIIFDTGSLSLDTRALVRTYATDSSQWVVSLDSMAPYNTTLRCTLVVQIHESVVLGTTLRATIPSDSARTYFTARSLDTTSAVRLVTFGKPGTVLLMNPIGDTRIPPANALGSNPCTVLVGRITPGDIVDSLTRFGLACTTSNGMRGAGAGDSISGFTLWLGARDSINLVVDNADSTLWKIPNSITIDSPQNFYVTMRVPSRRVMNGETIFVSIPRDSVFTLYSAVPAGNDSSGRQVHFFYPDSTRVYLDTLSVITINVDTDLNQNPFTLMSGLIQGQRYDTQSGAAAGDSIVRFGIVLQGSGADSVISVALQLGGDSTRIVSLAYGADSLVTFSDIKTTWFVDTLQNGLMRMRGVGNQETFIVLVTMSESTALGCTVSAIIPADSLFTYYLDTLSAVANNVRTVNFNIPVSSAVVDTISSALKHPVFAQWNNPDTIIKGYLQGQTVNVAIGDTIAYFAVRIGGTGKDSVQSCTLVLGTTAANREIRILTRINNGVAVGFDTWFTTDTYFFRKTDGTPDTIAPFYIDVRVSQYINQNATLSCSIPVSALRTQYLPIGPSSDATSGCTFTYRRGQMGIVSDGRNPAYPAALQKEDTREIMWFRAVISDTVEADTLHSLTINLLNAHGTAFDGTKVEGLYLYRDMNHNGRYDSSFLWFTDSRTADSVVGYFRQEGVTETWRLVIIDTGRLTTDTVQAVAHFNAATTPIVADTSDYLIVVRIDTTATDSRIQVRIPGYVAGLGDTGADGPFSEPGPAAAVTYAYYNLIPPDSTRPAPPTYLSVGVNPGFFTIEFDASPSGDTGMANGQYNLFWDSGTGSYPTNILKAFPHVSGQTVYSIQFPGPSLSNFTLVADSQYRFLVVAQDQGGNLSNATSIVSAIFRSETAPAAAASATLLTPEAGEIVWVPATGESNVMQVVAKIEGATSPVLDVTFAFRPVNYTGAGAYTTISVTTESVVDAAGSQYFTTDFNLRVLRPDTAYEIRAVARTASGLDTYAVSASITLATDTVAATYVSVPGDSRQELDSVLIEQVISTRSGEENIVVQTPSNFFDVIITLGQGALTTDTARIVVTAQRDSMTDTMINAIHARGVVLPRYWTNIRLMHPNGVGEPQRYLNGINKICLTYIDVNGDNIDDSTGVEMTKRVKIYTLTETGTLEALSDVTVDLVNRTICGSLRHFSPFFVSNDTGFNDKGLNRLLVGPNPYRPNDGNDQTGKPFVPGDVTSGILFKNLPNASRIEIYTILGEKVIEINKSDANATVNWGAVNSDGRPVASGYYLYVVTDIATGQRVTGKVAVIR
jgi:hypothetical protein